MTSSDDEIQQETFNLIINPDEYAEYVDFNALRIPNIQSVIEQSLPNHTDWKGIQDILASAKKEDTDRLIRAFFWEPFVMEEIELVWSCITDKATKLKGMQKELVKGERQLISQFAKNKYIAFVLSNGEQIQADTGIQATGWTMTL